MRINQNEKARVYANEKERNGEKKIRYSVSVGKKDMNGNWENAFMFARFRNSGAPNITPGGYADIIIKSGWIDFYKITPLVNGQPEYDAKGNVKTQTVWGIFINEYEVQENNPNQDFQTAPLPASFAMDIEDMPM